MLPWIYPLHYSKHIKCNRRIQEFSNYNDLLHIYKYWKPVGAISSVDEKEPLNILNAGNLSLESKKLIYELSLSPIGRLDKDSSGLLLLTNSEKLKESLLRTYATSSTSSTGIPTDSIYQGSKFEKVYEIKTLHRLSDAHIIRLSSGVIITTLSRRKDGDKRKKTTLPCKIYRNEELEMNKLTIHLREGRNRQIRKMIGALGHNVIELKRVAFAGIMMEGLEAPGDIISLNSYELNLINVTKIDL